MALVSFLSGGYNLHQFSDAIGLVLFIYLGFYVAFNIVQVISQRVVGRAEETSTYSSLGFCTVNCRPTELPAFPLEAMLGIEPLPQRWVARVLPLCHHGPSAPQVFTMIVKEVKLVALSRGIRIHQYLDDWLIRAQSPEELSHNTKMVVDLTESLGWMINRVKLELIPTQVFSFVGYEYHLNSALVKPTQERWQKLQVLILRITNQSALTARHLMSLIGLLASTEKMVPEGRLHMRPFQWHLKKNWTFPQSLTKLLPWSDSIIAHLDWWQNPQNVLKGAYLHP